MPKTHVETSKVIKDVNRHMFGLNNTAPRYIESWQSKMRNQWVKPGDVQNFQEQLNAQKADKNNCQCVIL